MAPFKFTRGIAAGEPIPVFNHGRMARDFTYIDDVVEAVVRIMAQPPSGGGADSPEATIAPYRIYNVGNGRPVPLMAFIHAIEACLGREANLQLLPMQLGDIAETMADVSRLERATGYRPATGVDEGMRRFVDWYRSFYKTPA